MGAVQSFVMPTLHSFLRYSTPEQRLGRSDQRQIETMRKWAIEHGFAYSDSYRAESISAFRGKQRRIGGLKLFFDDVRAGAIPAGDVLGVENFDRLSREPTIDALDLFRQIIRTGIGLIVRGDLYTEAILRREGWRWHVIVAEFNRANEESQHKSERVADVHQARRQHGRETKAAINGKNCPGWLKYVGDGKGEDGTGYEKIVDRVRVVRRIFALADTGHGLKEIAKALNADETPTFRNSERGWQPGYIQKILTSRAVLGEFTPHRYVDDKPVAEEPIEGLFPKIIDEALFERVRRQQEQKADPRFRGRTAGHTNLLKGLVWCACCGGPVGIVEGRRMPETRADGSTRTWLERRHIYAKCQAARYRNCDNRSSVSYSKLEPVVLRLSEVSHAIIDMLPRQPDDTETRIAVIESKIARLRSNREKLIDRFLGDDADSQIEDRVRRLGDDIKAHDRDLAELRRQRQLRRNDNAACGADLSDDIISRAAASDDAERDAARIMLKTALRRVIDRVTLTLDHHVLVALKPDNGYSMTFTIDQDGITRGMRVAADGFGMSFGPRVYEALLAQPPATIDKFMRDHLDLIPRAKGEVEAVLVEPGTAASPIVLAMKRPPKAA